MSAFTVTSADGTSIAAWRNDGEGVPLVIANGLGTTPESWPSLLDPGCGFDAVSWYHRGTFGSQRPADPARIRVEDHVADMVAVMDAAGVERAVVASWSIGVNVAFELLRRHPDRVLGLMAVAGVPGGTFSTMGGPLGIPRRLRRPIALRVARSGRLLGPGANWLSSRVPVTPGLVWVLTHTGFMLPAARGEVVVPMLEQFLQHDWRWYLDLALAAAEHDVMDLEFVECPVTLVAGKHDVLTSMHDIVEAASRIPHAQISVLPGSHFLPLEFPDLLRAALVDLARRSGVAVRTP